MSIHDAPKIPTVKVGRRVELELIDQRGAVELLAVEIVPDALADYDHGFLGEGTPLAQTILDQPEGKNVPYRRGDLQFARIVSITECQDHPDLNIAERRKEIYQKAVEQSDRTNAMIFASSLNGKWGDYDPNVIEMWDQDDSKNKGKPSKSDKLK